MSKESVSSPYPNLVFRETFNDEQTTRKNGGVPTDVDFSEGQGSFNGTSSKSNYNLGLNGTYSVRIRCNPTSFISQRFLLETRGSNNDGTGSIFLAITTGSLTASAGTLYVDGSASITTVAGVSNEIIVTGISLIQGTGANLSLIGSRLDNATKFLGTIDLVEIYEGTLTPSEVKNLYNNVWNKELPPTTERSVAQYACDLSYSGWERCADDNGTDAGGEQGAGKSLKAVGEGNGTDDFGFAASLPGYRSTNTSFYYLGSYLYLWSSTPASASTVWRRNVNTSYSTVNRDARNRDFGFSLRCLRDTDDTSDFTDPRDGTVYQCVRIGTQVWMKKNLAYLPSVNAAADGSETDPKYYVYDYDGTDVATAKASANYTNEGVLYNYPAAIISAPDGFHVPSDEELNILEVFVVKMIKLLNPNKTLIDFDSTNGVLELGDLNETFTATDVDIVKTGSNYGAKFDGVGSKIDPGSDMIGTKVRTIMSWIKPYSFGENDRGRIIDNGKCVFRVNPTNSTFRITSNGGGTSIDGANNSILLNQDNFIAVTVNSAGDETNMYRGDKLTSPALSGTSDRDSGTPEAGTTNALIGNDVASNSTFDGLIKKVKVVEGILSLAEITQVWSETLSEIN